MEIPTPPSAGTVGRPRLSLLQASLLQALAVVAAVASAGAAAAQTWPGAPTLAGYLPPGASYAPEVPTPASVLGFEVGSRAMTPGEQEGYLRRLAASSDRIRLEEQGRSHEGRPQLLLVFSSPANLTRLEELRERHLALTDPAAPAPGAAVLAEAPLVVWLAYSIHGDETSGANAAPVVAYHLAASRDPAVLDLLERAIVLLDPTQNPDGMARFAAWVASHSSAVPVADPQHREKRQPWPSGRGNHYWLDLNRDWLAAEQPESRSRVATFQRWRPHVVGDFHEMGSTGGSYFFQPGVPERTNPLTPARNQELTAAIARYHARALDRAGRRYFTRESYDDFYYAKGSTYPDVQGAIGILFEQAETAGRVIDTGGGALLDFPTAVHNHVLTSLSTLEGALALRDELVAHQVAFYRDPPRQAGAPAGWVCGDSDRGRVDGLARALRRHDVELGGLARPLAAGGATFEPERAFLVPAAQRQSRLLAALFEERSEFPSTTFYDVSAWTFPRSWDVPCVPLSSAQLPDVRPATSLGAEATLPGVFHASEGAVAYAFDWSAHLAPRALRRLLAAGVQAAAALRPITVATPDGERALPAGAILVPVARQALERAALERALAAAAAEDGVELLAVTSGLVSAGLDLGSLDVRPLVEPRVALAIGHGVDSSAAGALWHLLDRHWEIPTTLLERDELGSADLSRYTHLVLPDGTWNEVGDAVVTRLRAWVEGGGVLVALQDGARWTGTKLLPPPAAEAAAPAPGAAAAPAGEPPPIAGRYARYEDERARGLVAGAIFTVELDTSHPLGFGYPRTELATFRAGTDPLPAPANPFEVVARYSERPRVAGYAAEATERRLAGTPALLATRLGRGTVVRFADDPAFRTHWHGTEKLVANALFFARLVERTAPLPP